MLTVYEPARETPICYECDVCVIGGSCTGVFAAIAAARLGARVALVEALGYLGGTATASQVCVWHTHMDERFEREIIAGLSKEVIERLRRNDAVIDRGPGPHLQYIFAPYELAMELDQMVEEVGIRPFLHTRVVGCAQSDAGTVDAVIIEDKTGRRAIRASLFVDASGDADVVDRMGLETYKRDKLQPPTTCALIQGVSSIRERDPAFHLAKVAFDTRYPEALRPGFLWGEFIPGDDMYMVAGTRVHGADCSDADDLTRAEIEGRRQVRQILAIARQQPGGERIRLQGLPAKIGIRETRHAACLHMLREEEVLYGKRFPDAIANGSYRVDIHSADGSGLMLRYLDGREDHLTADGTHTHLRWRPETTDNPTFYQIPYGALVPRGAKNVLVAGRCIDADEGAFGAVRVMVNTTQMGQAAGVAAFLALDGNLSVDTLNTDLLRQHLGNQGAIII